MPDIFDRIWAKRSIRSSTSFILMPFFKAFINKDVESNYKSVHMQFESGIRFKAITDMRAFYKAATKGLKAEAKLVYRELEKCPNPETFNTIFTMLLHYLLWISGKCTASNFPSEEDVRWYLEYLLDRCNEELLTIHMMEVEKL